MKHLFKDSSMISMVRWQTVLTSLVSVGILAQSSSAQSVPVALGVQVTGTAGSTTVSWLGLAGVREYTVLRWMVAAPACCRKASGPLTTNSWADVLPQAGTYEYRVTVRYADGRWGFNDARYTYSAGAVAAGPSPAGAPGATPLPAPVPVAAPVVAPASVPPPATGPALPVPTGLSIRGGYPVSSRVTWNAVAGATSYLIERWVPADLTCCRAASGQLTTIGWVDTGLDPKYLYQYRESAFFPDGRSTSAERQYAPPKPVNPYNFIATQSANGDIQLSWAAVPGASYYKVSGPGVAGTDMRVDGTSQVLRGVSAGVRAWQLVTYYDPGPVFDATAPSRATLVVTAPVVATSGTSSGAAGAAAGSTSSTTGGAATGAAGAATSGGAAAGGAAGAAAGSTTGTTAGAAAAGAAAGTTGSTSAGGAA
ncbi:MAG TPA: hypothetical protein VGP87_07695, partial [Gemmatimonadales bacterium]|nr:hypothetical protein [Gemmatimonadales bacterium]